MADDTPPPDDRPRPRRRRDEDADDDDRPRRRRPKSGGSSTGLIIGIVVGVLALGMCIVVPVMIGLLLPAVQKVREAAGRATDQNNLKQMALAAHFQHDRTGQWRAPFAHDEKGTVSPGLSFRVGLLPYMDEAPLFARFDLKQAWDGPANRPLADQVPKAFTTPLNPQVGNTTPYRAFVGGGALFNADGAAVKMADIKDGTSNTILYVHAPERVTWTVPKELPYGPGVPLPSLTVPGMVGGTNVAMADGSVRFVRSAVNEATLRAMITRAGGEQVSPDW